MNTNFWRNKKVLITGHTGFKGSWLSLLLQSVGVDLVAVALEPPTQPNLFQAAKVSEQMTSIIGDIRDLDFLKKIQNLYQPEIIFHMAAQPLVRYSYQNPVETYSTNVMGTVNLLEAVRQSSEKTKAVIIVTSDKCYQNKEWLWAYREDEPLGGYDPYSNSKACTELVSAAFRSSYELGIATVRAGNVIGGGDWAQDRLIPDIIRSITNNEKMMIRYPRALRPWQHVLEPLHGYIELAEKMFYQPAEYAEAWNFGPNEQDVRSVQWIVEKIMQIWKTSVISQEKTEQVHEANYLKLDSSKAKFKLGWRPKWSIEQSLEKTVEWYQDYYSGINMQEKTLSQIKNYFLNLEVVV